METSRITAMLDALHGAYPDPRVELDHDGPLQLLVATILSAQCTDARVNMVTPALFRAFPDAKALASSPHGAIESAIRTTGFFRAKARSIRNCSRLLVERHGGEIPRTMEELTALPGVGRKTANVILSAGHGISAGIVVDTHMARVARRLGLTRQSDPVKIERGLMELIPSSEWIFFSITMVLHGRYICQARRPRCSECVLRDPCPSNDLEAVGVATRQRRRPAGRSQPRRRSPTRPTRPPRRRGRT